MENSREKDSGPTGLDDNLLVMMNGTPMKFYLLGYDMDTSRGMTEIIEALGGKSSELNAPDTFVFCERDCSLRAGEHNRYDIRYLYDSVVALENQKLENYKLHMHSDEQVWSVIEDEESIHVESEEEKDDKSGGSCNSKLSMTANHQWSSPDDYQFEKLHCNEENNNRDKENNIDDSSNTENHNGDSDSDSSWTAGIPRVNPLKTDRFVDVEHESQDTSEDEQSLEEDEQKSFSEDEEESNGSEDEHRGHQDSDEAIDVEGDASERSSEDEEDFDGSEDEQKTDHTNDNLSMEVNEEECVNFSDDTGNSDLSELSQSTNSSTQGIKKYQKGTIFTEEEDEKILGFVIKKNVIPKDFAKTIWTDMMEGKVLGNCRVSHQVLARHYRQKLKSHPTFKKFIKNFHKKEKSTKNESKTEIFTAEENRKIMKWVMQKNVIPKDYGTSVWNDMLRENVLQNCSVPARLLSQHYRQQLKHHPTFKAYVKRSTTSQSSKQMKPNPQKPPRRLTYWTEEEDRILIQYLIDNDAIHRGKSAKCWKNCWEANKSSFAPTRSENSLRMRFSSHLSNNYSKFTNDPEVLRKFQKLEQASRKTMK